MKDPVHFPSHIEAFTTAASAFDVWIIKNKWWLQFIRHIVHLCSEESELSFWIYVDTNSWNGWNYTLSNIKTDRSSRYTLFTGDSWDQDTHQYINYMKCCQSMWNKWSCQNYYIYHLVQLAHQIFPCFEHNPMYMTAHYILLYAHQSSNHSEKLVNAVWR